MHSQPIASRLLKFSHPLYALLLHVYPPDFRERFGREMMQAFDDCYPRTGAAALENISFWLETLRDFARSFPSSWWREFQETNESDEPSWMISIPVFVLAAIVLLAEGWFGAALSQHLGRPNTPSETLFLFRVNLLVSCGLSMLAGMIAVAFARRKQIDLVILNCSHSAIKAA
jgi:hypothetical protein